MRTWKKVFSIAGVAAMLLAVFVFCSCERKECCLCNSFRYHAPCLMDLDEGKLIELNLYAPHPTKVAELADPQPQMSTFSIISLGNVTGTKQTDIKTIQMAVPATEKTANPALCNNCRKQVNGLFCPRYVLADLYAWEVKTLIPIRVDLPAKIRCYQIDAQREDNVWNVTVQGILNG